MQYRRLGRTGLLVSEISLGTVELGLDYGIRTEAGTNQPTPAEAERLLHHAVDIGINFLDTAAAYGTSETLIGKALRDRRSEIYIATKCMHYHDPTGSAPEIQRQMTASIDESLRRLQTDRIDLIQIHGRDDPALEMRMVREGIALETLQVAKRAGKVRFIGYSSYLPEVTLAILSQGEWDTLQIAYNIFDRRNEETVIPAARKSDTGVIIRSALLKGALTDRARHLPEHLRPLAERTDRLRGLLTDRIATLPQLALRFVLSCPDISTVIVGADRTAYVEEAVATSDGEGLPGDVWEAVQSERIDNPDLLNPGKWGIP
ncbi:MAG: aldo/keto reductase [candidate division Zixibacteria bacterium]|nr:aldo/keto reductase [candidate division Zixibacteria bacterium]